MSDYYTMDQEKVLKQLCVIKEMVGAQDIRGTPCKLMLSQLQELYVFSSKLSSLTHDMIKATEDRLSIREEG